MRPSHRGLSAAERVGIYQGMYLPRMMEALESDYEGLAHFLGATAWTRLVRAYLTAHPSRSYTLNELGRRLPEFVRHARGCRARPSATTSRGSSAPWPRCSTPRRRSRSPRRSSRRSRPRDLERARLVPIAALRLLVLDHDAGAWLDSLRGDEHAHPPVRRKRTRVLVYRRSYGVKRREQAEAAFALLEDLVAGVPIGRALARALRAARRRSPRGRRRGVSAVPRMGRDGPVPGTGPTLGLTRREARP